MDRENPQLLTRIATTDADLRAAERLRYQVFVEELGGDGALVDHESRLEKDRFDPFCDHLVLIDQRRDARTLDHVVGVYRLMSGRGAVAAGQFYSEDEYDLSLLKGSGRRLLELGRSCLHPDYRGGLGMQRLWRALATHVREEDIEVLFGVASFHGNDVSAIAPSLSLLHHKHLAPPGIRVRAHEAVYQSMDILPLDQIDRPTAMRGVPPLIKAYLRLGGGVGDGAFIDREFNTIDVCFVLDTSQLNARATDLYNRGVE
ncbi:MAG: GNAT family N-acetyltransferase [Boseongicola sp.]